MASAVSYEYLKSIQGVPGGIPTLDDNGEIPGGQLPQGLLLFVGQYALETDLTTAYPTAEIAQFAYVDETISFWYWNAASTIEAWVNQEIEEADYILLTAAEQSMVPYLIVPTTVTP